MIITSCLRSRSFGLLAANALRSDCLLADLIPSHGSSRFFSGRRRRLSSSSSAPLLSINQARFPVDFLSNSFLSGLTTPTGTATASPTATANASSTVSTVSTADSASSSSSLQGIAAKTLTCQSDTEIQALQPSSTKRRSQTKAKSIYSTYLALAKPRLTALVVLSAMSSYALTPNDATVAQLLFLTAGTALSSASANAINMAREHKFDLLMTRTRTRPVVRGLITPLQAFQFAAATGSLGVAVLYLGVNPTVAALGAANIALYGGLYTSLKRISISNTWVGAIVGAIPPLMGWAASSSLSDPGAWCLAALLYAWQFPHFNSLSHSIRDEYRRAGYVMTAWKNPALNARVSLRYSLLMFPICIAMTYFGVTDWVFTVDSSLVNGWLTYWALKFWYEQRGLKGPDLGGSTYGQSSSPKGNAYARKLFWGSVWQLPAILVLAMIHKKGQWDWLFGSEDEF